MEFRLATLEDAPQIARLHADNWRSAYRGILTDVYLDGPIFDERALVWQQRLSHPVSNQWILGAWEDSVLCGFVCAFAANDPFWGTLVDNLHVRSDRKSQGLGKKLLHLAAGWANSQNPSQGIFLWVYEKNTPAKGFYEKVGGRICGRALHDNPGGGQDFALRYYWKR